MSLFLFDLSFVFFFNCIVYFLTYNFVKASCTSYQVNHMSNHVLDSRLCHKRNTSLLHMETNARMCTIL